MAVNMIGIDELGKDRPKQQEDVSVWGPDGVERMHTQTNANELVRLRNFSFKSPESDLKAAEKRVEAAKKAAAEAEKIAKVAAKKNEEAEVSKEKDVEKVDDPFK